MQQKSFFDAFSSKTSFGIGAATAILVLGTIGFVVLGGCLLKGGCSLDQSDNTVVVDDTQDAKDDADAAAAAAAAAKDEAGIIPVVNELDHVRGDADASITIIEYSDFECPYCSSFHETMLQVMDAYDGDINWVYRHFPLSFHANAIPAAEASECAAEQDLFWEYADELVINKSNLNETTYLSIASDLGMNISDFQSCLDSDRHLTTVNDQYQGGIAAGVTGTPGSFVIDQEGGATPIKGALPFETIQSLLDQLIAE